MLGTNLGGGVCNLSNFGLFVLGSTRFLQSFLGYYFITSKEYNLV